MSLRIFPQAALGIVLVASISGCAAISARHRSFVNNHVHGSVAPKEDPISGEWKVTFYVHDSKTPATFTFKLDGTKVTGTVYSEHTGAGTIREGKWTNGKLSMTLDFAKHQSIVVNGTLNDGKLVGEFTTEGFTDKWEALKK